MAIVIIYVARCDGLLIKVSRFRGMLF